VKLQNTPKYKGPAPLLFLSTEEDLSTGSSPVESNWRGFWSRRRVWAYR
jgi:hypothetical protein